MKIFFAVFVELFACSEENQNSIDKYEKTLLGSI